MTATQTVERYLAALPKPTRATVDALRRWPAPDRAVMTFADESAVATKRCALHDLFARWIEATTPPR